MAFPSSTYNIRDSNATYPYGMPLLDSGLVMQYAINGMGLVMRGLVWQGYDIWGPNGDENLSTVWTADSSSAITTTWTLDNMGNELPPQLF